MVQVMSSTYLNIIITVIYTHLILTCASTAPIHTYASYINSYFHIISCMAIRFTFLYTFHILLCMAFRIIFSYESTHGISIPVFHITYTHFVLSIFSFKFNFWANVKYIYIYLRKIKLPTHRYVVETKPPSLAQSHTSSEYVSLYVKFLINLV